MREGTHGERRDLAPGLPERVHVLGAGGAGLSGAAKLLRARGHVLTGHDRATSAFVDSLRAHGVEVEIGVSEARSLPESAQCVVRSAAVGEDDPQVARARALGLPILKYSDLLPLVSPPERTLAVAGTHGKTTTAWMLYHGLLGVTEATGRTAPAPGALIGGTHRELRENALVPDPGGWFAVEACEYDRTFLRLAPQGAIITNVEADHLDYYGSMEAIETAFARFANRIHPDGLLVVGADVPESIESAARCSVWRLERELHVDLSGERQGRFEFRLRGPGWATTPVRLAVPGRFNVENGALALSLAIGLLTQDWRLEREEAAACAARALSRFTGVERRFEPWGTSGDVEVVHDYAHHPTEVRATLEAARRALPGRTLHVLFQPHQHSRTARFMKDFVEVLRGADRVVVTDVYGARAHIDNESAGAAELVRRLGKAGVDATCGGAPLEAARVLADGVPTDGAVLVLGAGDVDEIRDDLFDHLALRGAARRGPVR